MISKKPTPRLGRFWTASRAVSTALVFGLLLVVASSCNRATDDVPGGKRAPAANTAASKAAPQPAEKSMTEAQRRLQASSTTPFPSSVFDTEIKGVDGQPFRLADYKGKVVVLDLWATWCGPCRNEMRHLAEIQKQYAGKGVEVIGITKEDPELVSDKVEQIKRELNINYKLAWVSEEFADSVARADSIPQTYVLGRDGRPIRFFSGYWPYDLVDGDREHVATPARMQKAIEQALGGASNSD